MPFRVSPLVAPAAVITVLLISQMGLIQLHNPTPLTDRKSKLPFTPVSGTQPTLVVLVGCSDKTNSTSPTRIAGTLPTITNYYAADPHRIVPLRTTLRSSVTTPWYCIRQTRR